jgi:HAE1 family hydrophobic/amphiphilic exporter-1
MTVIPLFCSRFLKAVPGGHGEQGSEEHARRSWGSRVNAWFNRGFNKLLDFYERSVRRALKRPALTLALLIGVFVASLGIYPLLGLAFFPRTDAGQFTVNVKVPTGTRIEVTNDYVAKIEDLIRHIVDPKDLKMVLSNIGVVNDISALYTANAGMYTATIQVALSAEHHVSSFDYMDRVKGEIAEKFPDVRTFFQSGSM